MQTIATEKNLLNLFVKIKEVLFYQFLESIIMDGFYIQGLSTKTQERPIFNPVKCLSRNSDKRFASVLFVTYRLYCATVT